MRAIVGIDIFIANWPIIVVALLAGIRLQLVSATQSRPLACDHLLLRVGDFICTIIQVVDVRCLGGVFEGARRRWLAMFDLAYIAALLAVPH